MLSLRSRGAEARALCSRVVNPSTLASVAIAIHGVEASDSTVASARRRLPIRAWLAETRPPRLLATPPLAIMMWFRWAPESCVDGDRAGLPSHIIKVKARQKRLDACADVPYCLETGTRNVPVRNHSPVGARHPELAVVQPSHILH